MKPSSYPKSHLLNPAFAYVPAANTDVAKTIAHAREAMAAQQITKKNVREIRKAAK